MEPSEWHEAVIAEVRIGGAVVFVVPVARFLRIPPATGRPT